MKRKTTAATWLALTLGLGVAIAFWKPELLPLWLVPGVPPPGPLGGKRQERQL